MSVDSRQLRLTIPGPLSNSHVVLTPLTQEDAAEIGLICDVAGIKLVDVELEQLQAPDGDPCQSLQWWAALRAAAWKVDFELPVGFVQACFAVREEGNPSRLAGIVGFNSPYGWTNRMNVYYWTAPGARGREVAPNAVVIGRPWALKTFGVSEAFINATSEASNRVAEKAGFTRMSNANHNSWLYSEAASKSA